jgi:hypothetical protein
LYPGIVSQYPAIYAGRDNGATVWGKLFEKKFVYAVGAFEGHNRIAGASNQSDNPLFAGRVAYNFFDPEPDPAYYTSSTYYGSANVLTLAFDGMYQHKGVGTVANAGDYKSWSTDLLFERNLGGNAGVVTLEGAFYDYSTSGVTDVATTFGGATSTSNVGGLSQGDAYLVSGAYLIAPKVGPGQFQPVVRYQKFDNGLTKVDTDQVDLGVNYILKGHNARISADFAHDTTTNAADNNKFILGAQVQF